MRLDLRSTEGETFEAFVTLSPNLNRLVFKRLREAFFTAMEEVAEIEGASEAAPRTGAERYFAERMNDPEYAISYKAAATSQPATGKDA